MSMELWIEAGSACPAPHTLCGMRCLQCVATHRVEVATYRVERHPRKAVYGQIWPYTPRSEPAKHPP